MVGEAGIGKSTSADRLYMQQLALFEAGADRRVPVYMRARDVAPGELSMRVLEASQFGDVVHDGAVVIIDGADEPGPSTAVSYTHLDVYKRQCQHDAGGREERPGGRDTRTD